MLRGAGGLLGVSLEDKLSTLRHTLLDAALALNIRTSVVGVRCLVDPANFMCPPSPGLFAWLVHTHALSLDQLLCVSEKDSPIALLSVALGISCITTELFFAASGWSTTSKEFVA